MNTLANIIGWIVIVIFCVLVMMNLISRWLDYLAGWQRPSGRRPRP